MLKFKRFIVLSLLFSFLPALVIGQNSSRMVNGNEKSYFQSSNALKQTYDQPLGIEPAKPIYDINYDPKDYPAPSDQGGEDISTAITLSGSLPITASGTTSGYVNDYDESCPYASTSPDVVYKYTPVSDIKVDITLCNDPTNYDTKLYVYDIPNPVSGDAIACNDDYCTTASSPFVSEVKEVSFSAGITYYIVVDGYGGYSGNYELTVLEHVPNPVMLCPDETIFGMDASNYTSSLTSDVGIGYKVFNYFEDMGSISEIHWWGTSLYLSGINWIACYENPRNFEIAIWSDDAGIPGTQLSPTYSAAVSGTDTGEKLLGVYTIYEYSFTLPSEFIAESGWVSIWGSPAGNSSCWFAWINTGAPGVEAQRYNLETEEYASTGSPTSMCLLGSVGGCFPPTDIEVINLTPGSAELGWTSTSGSSNMEWGPEGFSLGSGTSESGVSSTFTLSPLSPGEGYDVYLQDDCGGGVISGWTGPFTFYTPPGNDDCVSSTEVSGPYPQLMTGTTVHATSDCFTEPTVWYALDLPYEVNRISVDFCSTPENLGYGIDDIQAYLVQDCGCDLITADMIDWNSCSTDQSAPYYEFWDVPGPGTIYLPVTVMNSSSSWETAFEFIVDVESRVELDLTVFLEGPYSGASTMSSVLKLSGHIPTDQPYDPPLPYMGNNTPVWLYAGSENASPIPTGVVDWILVQLRDTDVAVNATPATEIATVAAFLLDDGKVVSLDGVSNVVFSDIDYTENLFVVIFHRNHLGIMSANELTALNGIYSIDFTSGYEMVYGGVTGYKEIEPGVWGMVSADGNADGVIDGADVELPWSVYAGEEGYKAGDFNLDGQVNNLDKIDLWLSNSGQNSNIPQ